MTQELIYLKNTLEGMTGDELILFIYAENVKVLQMARHYFDTGEVEPRVLAINKSVKLISSLMSVLNFQAGEVAFQLKSLYTFSIKQLMQANYEKKPEHVDTVLGIFRNLYNVWKEKMDKDRQIPGRAQEQTSGGEMARSMEIYG
jgi:flagellar secretion chaperone FliS